MSCSIIQNNKACLVCGTEQNLHKHHIFEGSGRRRLSERYGCWCYLCGMHHNLSKEGVHFNKELDLKIKRRCQSAWEEKEGDRESFIKVFTKSYL